MYHQNVRNVREALPSGLHFLSTQETEESRNGPVFVADGPVFTTYERPGEMVLFSPVRDANPFFHLAESVWMLAGRDDAEFLDHYVRDFGSRFAEYRGQIHDAYGRRWRSALGFDQLDEIVRRLKREPDSRQCVLQMWDAAPLHDASIGGAILPLSRARLGEYDLAGSWRTKPCNTHVYLRVRRQRAHEAPDAVDGRCVLDLTLCCRSNDAVLGAHGANAVHFAILQEYLAARIGVGVGRLHQLSNNYHVYVSEIERLFGRLDDQSGADGPRDKLARVASALEHEETYSSSQSPPLFESPDVLDEEITELIDNVRTMHDWSADTLVRYAATHHLDVLQNWFLDDIQCALFAHRLHRGGARDAAVEYLARMAHDEWRCACTEWLERRSRA